MSFIKKQSIRPRVADTLTLAEPECTFLSAASRHQQANTQTCTHMLMLQPLYNQIGQWQTKLYL